MPQSNEPACDVHDAQEWARAEEEGAIERRRAYEALVQAKATLEITALYFQQQPDAPSQSVLGMLMAAALVMQEVQEGLESGKL
jgi:hypothetical protein